MNTFLLSPLLSECAVILVSMVNFSVYFCRNSLPRLYIQLPHVAEKTQLHFLRATFYYFTGYIQAHKFRNKDAVQSAWLRPGVIYLAIFPSYLPRIRAYPPPLPSLPAPIFLCVTFYCGNLSAEQTPATFNFTGHCAAS